jgi:sugar lactone lactonase YvrE
MSTQVNAIPKVLAPAQSVWSAQALLGEGVLWSVREQALYWVDILGHRLHRYGWAQQSRDSWSFDEEISAVAERRSGPGLLVSLRHDLAIFDTQTSHLQRVHRVEAELPGNRFNDGKCDAQGRFWAGTIYEPRDRPAAALYRYDEGGLTRCAGQVTTANGLAWSLDGATLYWADTRAHAVYSMDFDLSDGSLSNQRLWRHFEPRAAGQALADYAGRPDGAAVDSDGCYWVAMYEGAQLQRLNPQGETIEVLRLPVQCPTMPCFGGPDLRTLYITTASQHRPAAELAAQPLAGCVLAIEVQVPGLPVNFCKL